MFKTENFLKQSGNQPLKKARINPAIGVSGERGTATVDDKLERWDTVGVTDWASGRGR